MSLIINMLKDLEKNNDGTVNVPPLALKQKRMKRLSLPGITFSPSKSATVVLIMLAIISLSFTSVFVTIKNKKYNHVTGLLPSTQISTPELNPTMIAKLKPTVLSGVTIQEGTNITTLHFNMNQPTLYRLAETGKHFYLTFENAALSSMPLDSVMQNSAIHSVKSVQLGKDTQFNLALTPGWKVKSAQIVAENGHFDFQLNLVGKTITKDHTVENKIESTIKKPVTTDQFHERYQNAIAKAEAGATFEAINQLSALILDSKSYHQARTALVALLIKSGKTTQASRYIEAGLKLAPQYIPFIELKARLLAMNSEITRAIALLNQARPDINDYPDFYAFLAALYEQTNQDNLSANIYHQLIDIDPKNSNWWFGLALSMDKVGNRKEAIYAYTKAYASGGLNTASLDYLQTRLAHLNGVNHETY